jgi:hypothetical protein
MADSQKFRLLLKWAAIGGVAVLPSAILFPPIRDGVIGLIDHWKTERIVIREVPVEVVKEKVVVKEVPVVKDREVVREIPVEVVKETVIYRDIEADRTLPPPPPLPPSFVPNKKIEVKDLFNEMQIRTEVAVRKGGLSSAERKRKGSYVAQFQVVVNVPEATDSLKELAQVNGQLPAMLPGLKLMLPKAKVSGFFHLLYKDKLEHLQQKLTNLEKTLSRHNFYDCETILELVHPSTQQKVLLVQADMDVVADGSDGDRLGTMDPAVIGSAHFQAETSYRWPKQTARPNPLLGVYQERLRAVQVHLKGKASSDYQFKRLTSTVKSLQKESFLIGQEDPFIVVPLSTRLYVDHHAYTPRMGDYAVVIYKNQLYPAICGDYGPKTKIGEGSLRLAQALNAKATPNYRPVSDLAVTYLIFPNSRDLPPGPPNYAQWSRQCQALLQKIGGLGAGYTLHAWQDRLGGQPGIVPVR